MHKNSSPEDNEESNQVLHRGKSIYYIGSMFFVAGIALLILGSAFIMIFQLHYNSEPEQIFLTTIFMGTGITLILIGINLMIKQSRKGYGIVGTSTIISSIAIIIFSFNYFNNWYYPIISYVLALYIVGFLTLLGNAFANVTLWIIENRSGVEHNFMEEKTTRIYTDEEIQRDIEKATRKSLEAAASQLEFDIFDSGDIKLGKSSPKLRGYVTRIKDDIDEVKNLQQTVNPGSTEKWGSVGIEKASMQLAEAITQKENEDKQYKGFRGKLFKRFKKK